MLGTGSFERRVGRRSASGRDLKGLRRDAAASRIVDLVAAARGHTRAEILCGRRCSNEIAGTRQLAMYLVHTLLGRTYFEVGQLFGRDRTTVSHACARIEDLRDRKTFEREVEAIEAAVAAGEGDHAAP